MSAEQLKDEEKKSKEKLLKMKNKKSETMGLSKE